MKKLLVFLMLLASPSALFSEVTTPNTPAPDFRLKLYGTDNNISLTGLSDGKNVIIISFFDTSCKPCRKELPKLHSINNNYSDKAKVYLICLDSKPEDVLPEYKNTYGVTLPILLDPQGIRAGERYGVIKFGSAEIPQVFVIGKDGVIKKRYKGYHEDIEEQLAADIKLYSAEVLAKPLNNNIEIVYSGSSNGYLESCNCPQNPFGGIVRKITTINKLKEKNPNAIVVDSGDYFPPRQDKLLSDYALKMIKLIDYDLIAIGDQEILEGIENMLVYSSTVPFYSSNLQTCNDKMCFPFNKNPFIIKTVNGVKIAVLSVISPDIFFLFPKDKMKNVKISDQMTYLQGIIPLIKKEADIIVLVSHCGDEIDSKIAQTIPGIDVIIGGHSQTFYKEPLKVNNTLIVQGGQNSHRIGILELKTDDKKRITGSTNTYILLDKEVADDPEGKIIVDEYKTALKENIKKLTK